MPVFAAFVTDEDEVRIGPEHDRYEWLHPAEARSRFAWPRERRALDEIVMLVGGGDGGTVDDVLRVC